MFDAKEIAKKLAGKGGAVVEMDMPEGESDGNTGPGDALRDMFNAMKAGHFDVAADAFRAAVMSCHDEGDDE